MNIPPNETSLPAKPAARKPRWGLILTWVGIIALLVLVATGLFRSSQGPVAIGQQVPNFTLTTFEGEQISLTDLQGKVVVMNFWASWCTPCAQEAADLEAAWRYYEPRGDVIFLGVNWTDTEPEAMKYMNEFDITYPSGPDLGTRIADRFRITGVPETYIIDQNGTLVYLQISPFASIESIKAKIDPLLAR